jgi:class 3 adenylate cyclase
MESHGVPGKVHVTRATQELLKDDFECVKRGEVPIKGKGNMETWFVVGARNQPPQAPAARIDAGR